MGGFTPSNPNKTKWNGNTRTNLNTLFLPPLDARGSVSELVDAGGSAVAMTLKVM